MNVIVLDGRIANEPELKHVGSKSTPLLVFTMANETGFGDYKQTGFWKCELWGTAGEKMANHLFKGKPFFVQGELQQDSWETPEGYKRSRPKIKVDKFSFHMADPKNKSESQPTPQSKDEGDDMGENPFGDDIPF